MPDFILTLGGVGFGDFETPDGITGGGGQLLQIHKYAGGERKIDAFGPDNDPIQWGGTFTGPDAEARCQQLDSMRVAGEPVDCAWGAFSYLVVIRDFKFNYKKFWLIEYTIALEVVVDDAQAQPDGGFGLEDLIQEDLDDTADFAEAIGNSSLSALVDPLLATAASVPSIIGAGSIFLDGFSGQITTVLDFVGGMVTVEDMLLEGVADMVSGMPPSDLVAELTAVGESSSEIAMTFALQSTLGRLQRNVGAIMG